MIKELIAAGSSRNEVVAILIEQLGFTQSAAEMVFAIETGIIDGDIVDEDERPATYRPLFDLSGKDTERQ